jgi:hypothetical protein
MSMGHAITGGGFFNIDIEPLRACQGASEVFTAVIKFDKDPLTEERLSDELKVLMDDQTMRLCTGSGKLHLPLSKRDTEIREGFISPRPSLVLPSGWVKLTGVPEDLMVRDRLMAAFTMIGRPIDVDELSVMKRDTEPVRMRFQCRYPDRIKGSVQVFVNGEGFTVCRLSGRRGGRRVEVRGIRHHHHRGMTTMMGIPTTCPRMKSGTNIARRRVTRNMRVARRLRPLRAWPGPSRQGPTWARGVPQCLAVRTSWVAAGRGSRLISMAPTLGGEGTATCPWRSWLGGRARTSWWSRCCRRWRRGVGDGGGLPALQ